MASELARAWPTRPYKGLGFYTEADAPLFAGRDRDIARASERLAEWKCRLLLLHGSTGCGKSSFLRAGLIPYIENRSIGIKFVRTGPADQTGPLLVRSTGDPLSKLSDAVHRFAARNVTLSTPDGPYDLNLSSALPEHDECNIEAFIRTCSEQPDALVRVLDDLSRLVPQTLVLIIDQGEEVLTVDNTDKGEEWRAQFFGFLSGFVEAQPDIKLLIALRTEYLGRFVSRLRRSLRDPSIRDYFPDELGATQIKEAVLRPTSTKPVGSLGAPADRYRFSFSARIVDNIIAQLERTAAGKLTAVQIVCGALYDLVKERDEPRTVTFDDLDSIGGVEGSIERFVDQQLRDCAKAMRLPEITQEEEIVRWKKVLLKLALLQPDGTVTTELRPEESLSEELKESSLDFCLTTSRLLDARVLREGNVINAESGKSVRCFGLGHDTLGLVLRNWKVRYDRNIGDTPLHTSEARIDDETTSLESGSVLCLSGDGFRAMLFHVGALWRLYEADLLRSIKQISSVSASSITAGFLGLNWNRLSFDPGRLWGEFVPVIVAPLRALAGENLDTQAVALGLMLPGSVNDRIRADYDRYLFRGATLQDLPDEPRFMIIATNVQSGALWRFTKPYMGDYRVGRVARPRIELARAVAASSATPPVLSPCEIRLSPDEFTPDSGADLQREPFTTNVMLTDGGVYDNLALETAWKRYRRILVSDGGGRILLEEEEPSKDWARHGVRVSPLLDNQIRGFRKRQLIDSFSTNARKGAYWGIRTDISAYQLENALPCPYDRVIELGRTPARLQRLDDSTQERLINWGYGVCDAAIRKFVDPQIARPTGFPYPAVGV